MPYAKTILIAAATGNIGRKLTGHFRAADYPVWRLCLNPAADPDVQTCDLSVYDEA